MTPDLLCAICLHMPPGDADANRARASITIINGMALCEEHVEWVELPTDLQEFIELDAK